MLTIIAKKDLVRLASRTVPVAAPKSTKPVLEAVLLTAIEDRLECQATDLIAEVRDKAPAEVTEAGSIAVHGKDFLERIKHLPDGPVRIKTEETAVVISAEGSKLRYRMQGIPANEFPSLSAEPVGESFTLDSMAPIDRVADSICQDDGRANLSGLNMTLAKGKLILDASNGYAISRVTQEVGSKAKSVALVPLRAVQVLRKMTGASRITIGDRLWVENDGLQYSCKLVDATFPPSADTLLKVDSGARKVVVTKAALLRAITAVGLSSSQKTGQIVLSLDTDKITVSAENPETGDAADEIDCSYGGEPIRIGFNLALLRTLCTQAGEEVTLWVTGELEKMNWESSGIDGVVMPMRIQ